MKKKLERIKDTISSSNKLTDEQKSSSFKIIEEWSAEDKAFGILFEKFNRDFKRYESLF